MAHAALEWPKKTAARAYGTLARLRLARCGSGARSIHIYQKTHLIVASYGSRTQVSDKEHAAIPLEVCGVSPSPAFYTIPGVHAYLDHYACAMEHARTLLKISSKRTVDSLQCLPFGPFSERRSPHIAESSDLTTSKRFRNPEDSVGSEGRAFQVDSTSGDVSILTSLSFQYTFHHLATRLHFWSATIFPAVGSRAAAILAQTGHTAFSILPGIPL